MNTYKITIIGFGITGMLLLAILNKNSINLSNICIIDPYYDGGNLLRLYGDVISNTPFSKAVNALKMIDSNYTIPEEYANYDLNKTTPLSILAHMIKDFIKPNILL